MKVKCSICGIKGVLQVRGNSQRVQHYMGFKDGKRLYQWHKIERQLLPETVVNGSKSVVVNNQDSHIFQQIEVDGAGFEPASSAMPTLRSYQTDLPAHTLRNLPF